MQVTNRKQTRKRGISWIIVWRGLKACASVCQMGRPGSNPVWSICFRKVEFYQHTIDLSHQCCRLVQQRPCYVLSCILVCDNACKISLAICLCNNACKRSLPICGKSKTSCPVGKLLSVPISCTSIWPACAVHGWYGSNKQKSPEYYVTSF